MRTSAPSSIESIEKYLASGMRYRTSLHRENGQGLRRGRVRDHRDARYTEAALAILEGRPFDGAGLHRAVRLTGGQWALAWVRL